jgi:hypothetical protein
LTRAFVKKPFTSTRPVSSTVRFAAGAGAGAVGEGGVCAASGRATAASETSNVDRISGSWRFRYDYSKLQRLERNREQAMRRIPLLVGVGCITAVPRVVVVPVGSTVRFQNHDPSNAGRERY